jgi:hypothetical protein
MLVLPNITLRMILSKSSLFFVTRNNINMSEKESASAQIIYHYSTSPKSILSIVIYIFTTRKV